MKITAKKYAQALLEATEGKSEKDVKLIIARLLHLVIVNNGLKDADALIKNFVELWNKKNSLSLVDVTTAVEMTASSQKMITEYITKILKVEKVEINKKINKNILGGVIIREGDRVFDGSLRGRLYDLKEQIS
jgi:F-type H+-transporting ATPase subunit delta